MEKRQTYKTSGSSVRSGVLGHTRDGVAILKPRSPATHFTDKEVQSIVREVHSGRFIDAPGKPVRPSKGK